ncbi:MAG TPA: efflux RND transporter periplasmic adaptor subunit [Polyangiaceae bacterium]
MTARRSAMIPALVTAGVLVVIAAGWALVFRAESKVNKVALADAPRPITVIPASDTTFRDSRSYVGTLRPWIEANVGPQFISAYVDTVLVRPGAVVKRGEVLATLDCRNASAQSQAVAAEARAIETRQRAVADQAARMQSLLDGGFIDPNTVQQNQAQSVSEEAQLAAQRAKLTAQTLEVNDCILRAPFDGEIATRTIDPGAFVRPGNAIVSVVDRNTVRMNFDVPESDFDAVAVGTPVSIHVVATDKTLGGAISRRSPSADPDTRTVHVECDLADPNREIPVNTTGEARIEVGQPIHATAVPLYAASITGTKAALFLVDNGVARKSTFPVLGERGSDLFLDTSLKPGTLVVTEGRTALSNGEHVAPTQVAYAVAPVGSTAAAPTAGAKP